MSIIARLVRAIRRARLSMAEQDLEWMETIGQHNLHRQRAQVATLRKQLGHNGTAPLRAADIARNVSRRAKSEQLQ